MNRSRVSASAVGALATAAVLSSTLVGASPALAAAPASPGVSASADQQLETVQVSGKGEAFGDPDVLTANFAVETTGPTVDDALGRATAAATRMRDTLIRAGVARTDLQTANAGISSTRNDDGKITGYTVTQGLTAKIRDLPRAGTLLSTTINAGGDAARLNGVAFAIENDAALLTEARKKAFADARQKAELYAGEAGRPLGRVVKVTEATTDGGGWGGDRMLAADSPMVLEPGRLRLTVTVTVEWLLQPTRPSKRPTRTPPTS
jgi:uncharacterized protein YggE